VARRQHLTDAQIVELFDPPTDQRELVRHYTLSDADLAAIRRCQGSPQILSENTVGLRALRAIPEVTKKAA
jgi:hypothetical protein